MGATNKQEIMILLSGVPLRGTGNHEGRHQGEANGPREGSRAKSVEKKEVTLTDPIREVRVCSMELLGKEKTHSSQIPTQRPITAHFWGSVRRGSMAGGQPVCLGRGKGGESRVWLAMRLERAATDRYKRRDLMV